MTSVIETTTGDTSAAEWLISVDDHVIEPPNVWQDRLPSKFKAAGPRLLTDDNGEAWFYEDKRIPTLGLSAAAGRKKEEFSPLPLAYADMRPGCYDSVARVGDMDQARILASLCFPSFPRLCGQTFYEGKDKELGELCVRAYNDFMIDECAATRPAATSRLSSSRCGTRGWPPPKSGAAPGWARRRCRSARIRPRSACRRCTTTAVDTGTRSSKRPPSAACRSAPTSGRPHRW
jgi:hypothetical protein